MTPDYTYIEVAKMVSFQAKAIVAWERVDWTWEDGIWVDATAG